MTDRSAPSLQEIASCIAGYDPKALPVAQAQEFIARLVPPVQAVERLALRSGLGRVLARNIVAASDVPGDDNSAMDGYALRGSELRAAGDSVFTVAGKGFAGQRFEGAAAAGQCVRIMTGAVMPAGLDTVVPQEFVVVDGTEVRVPHGVVHAGDNRRLAGEDLARGSTVLAAGRVLVPADLGLLASLEPSLWFSWLRRTDFRMLIPGLAVTPRPWPRLVPGKAWAVFAIELVLLALYGIVLSWLWRLYKRPGVR